MAPISDDAIDGLPHQQASRRLDHAGCAVTRGEKWIATVFIRDGVDEYWRQWWAFDTYGKPHQWWDVGGARAFTPL